MVKVIVTVGDCEYNTEIVIECKNLIEAQEISVPLENFGINIIDVTIEGIK